MYKTKNKPAAVLPRTNHHLLRICYLISWFVSFRKCLQITLYIVVKQAVAPITWLANSAQKTPCTPSPMFGSSSVSGATSTIFLSREKKAHTGDSSAKQKLTVPPAA